ncbi:hypothetical protein JZ751_022877 [Albula glossodonta]|uniref:Uncharacterized protein n=1 Tax=Albula glossodonta TaxID=121402 RepID=A0A8T2PIR2_9TELE|nr:hypothetical protein JZ751_022877 [Albula glossodonta]
MWGVGVGRKERASEREGKTEGRGVLGYFAGRDRDWRWWGAGVAGTSGSAVAQDRMCCVFLLKAREREIWRQGGREKDREGGRVQPCLPLSPEVWGFPGVQQCEVGGKNLSPDFSSFTPVPPSLSSPMMHQTSVSLTQWQLRVACFGSAIPLRWVPECIALRPQSSLQTIRPKLSPAVPTQG